MNWFETAFDDFYADLYAHRDVSEAALLLATLDSRVGWEGPAIDIACGAGRLLTALDARWFSVGIDLSASLLHRARESESEQRRALRLIRADMRHLPFARERFGAAFSLFTSFGYFDTTDEDRQVADGAHALLRDRGIYVLDFLNARSTRKGLVPFSEKRVDGFRVEETRRVDESGPFVRKTIRIVGKAEADRIYEERVRLYEPSELCAIVDGAGFDIEEMWGGYDGVPFEPDSGRVILVGRKRIRS